MSTSAEFRSKKRSMGGGQVVIQSTPVQTTRTTRVSYGGPGMTSMRRSTNVMTSSAMAPAGEASRMSQDAVQNVKGTRGKEKKELTKLNGRLANHIENARYNESLVKALTAELERLKALKGLTFERVREEFKDELEEARDALEECKKEISPLQAKIMKTEDKVDTLEVENEELRKRIQELLGNIEKLNNIIGEQEAEMNALRRSIENLQRERDFVKKDLASTRDDNDRLRNDLEAARVKQIDAENDRDNYREQLEFVELTSEKEIEELKELIAKLSDSQPIMKNMWKSEFEKCICELQDQFDDKLNTLTIEQQRRYDEKIANIEAGARRMDNTDAISKTENKTLKSQMGDMRSQLKALEDQNKNLQNMLDRLREESAREREECENEKDDMRDEIANLHAELQKITHDIDELNISKMDLELEIQCYKKLLDGEESKIRDSLERQSNMQSSGGASLAGVISGGLSGGGSSSQSSKPVVTMSHSTGRLKVSKTSKCAIQLKECSQSGGFVWMENTLGKDFNLTGWKLVRESMGSRGSNVEFKFPDCTLAGGKDLKVFASRFDEEMRDEQRDFPNRMVLSATDFRSWGTGNGTVKLLNPSNDEKASLESVYIHE